MFETLCRKATLSSIYSPTDEMDSIPVNSFYTDTEGEVECQQLADSILFKPFHRERTTDSESFSSNWLTNSNDLGKPLLPELPMDLESISADELFRSICGVEENRNEVELVVERSSSDGSSIKEKKAIDKLNEILALVDDFKTASIDSSQSLTTLSSASGTDKKLAAIPPRKCIPPAYISSDASSETAKSVDTECSKWTDKGLNSPVIESPPTSFPQQQYPTQFAYPSDNNPDTNKQPMRHSLIASFSTNRRIRTDNLATSENQQSSATVRFTYFDDIPSPVVPNKHLHVVDDYARKNRMSAPAAEKPSYKKNSSLGLPPVYMVSKQQKKHYFFPFFSKSSK